MKKIVALMLALVLTLALAATAMAAELTLIIASMDTMKQSCLSLFALAAACALGELMSYYQLNVIVQSFFMALPGGYLVFILVTVAFFLFVGTFMDAVPAMILFVPIILPCATAMGMSPLMLGLIIVITLALGLTTPPYGLCLLIASSIADLSVERSFKGVLPYFLVALGVLMILVLFPNVFIAIPKALFPAVF